LVKQLVDLEEIACHFHDLEDPRSQINLKHPFGSVVVIALMAVLAGANGPTAIAQWARYKEEFLRGLLDLPHGIPSKDVFRRVLGLLDPAAFQACFANWLRAMRQRAAAATGIEQPVLAVDGKSVRRSHDRKSGLGALHSVSVWASEYGLSLGQVACAEKSNEITAIPEVLKLVDVRGAIVTIDAMGTQKAIAKQIVEQGADYVLALKANHQALHQAVVEHLDGLAVNDFKGVRQHTTTATAHGREETRCYMQVPVPSGLPDAAKWEGLRSLGLAVSAVVRDGKETIETRYYLSSLPVCVKRFAHAVRSHWGIENGCHWCLDMTFREDESRIADERLRENFAWMNRFALSLLKQHPSRNSIVGKRRGCSWNDDFLLQVLTASTA
jgi:predicted transposase YbfD/YdcC